MSGEKHDLNILLADVTKAFDKVQLGVILKALDALFGQGKAQRLKQLVQSMYTGASTLLSSDEGFWTIQKLSGILQGDSLSSTLFIILMNHIPLGTKLRNSHGYKLLTSLITPMLHHMFADDLWVITSTSQALQQAVDEANGILSTLLLHLSPEKSVHLQLGDINPVVTLNDRELRKVTVGGTAVALRVAFKLTPANYMLDYALTTITGHAEMLNRLDTSLRSCPHHRSLPSSHPRFDRSSPPGYRWDHSAKVSSE